MRGLPDSAFGRAALAIALVLIGMQLLLLLPLRGLMFGPIARQTGNLFAHQVACIQDRLAAAPPSERAARLRELVKAGGLRLTLDAAGPRGGEPFFYYQRILGAALGERLGAGAEYRMQWNDDLLMWVRPNRRAPYWIGLPLDTLDHGARRILLIWAGLTLMLSLATGFALARSLTSSLRHLATLAARIGRGEPLAVAPRQGPREVRILGEAMERMAGDLRHHAEEKALLLAGISHDLRTPLARMRLSAELLGEPDPATRDSLIEDIDEMDAIIGAFIASVREERAAPEEARDPNDLVRQAAIRLTRAGVTPALDLAPLPPCRLRPGLLARALDNLLENARRHGAPPITLRTRDQGVAGIRISVLDRGPGLTPDELSRIFQPFARGAAARPGGSGLGLGTARRLVREQGGELSLHPRQGGGLEARIELPLNAMQA